MGLAVGLRLDYSAVDLRALARRSSDAAQVRRLLALALVYAGGTRREAALCGGVGLQTVRAFGFAVRRGGPGSTARLIGAAARRRARWRC